MKLREDESWAFVCRDNAETGGKCGYQRRRCVNNGVSCARPMVAPNCTLHPAQ
jgi:hypothetical protein